MCNSDRGVLAGKSIFTTTLLALVVGCPQPTDPNVVVAGDHTLVAGESLQLDATTTDGTDASYTWSSDATSVASVDEDGLVAALAPGEAMITATGASTGASGAHLVVVTRALPGPDPTVTITGSHRVQAGSALTLTAVTTGGTDSGYIWSSSDADVASVTGTGGVVNGLVAGEATITATGADTGVEAQFAMVVTAAATAGGVVVAGAFYLAIGDSTTLTATTLGVTDSGYAWSSDDETVATVDAVTGAVTGLSAGQVTITATGADTGASGVLGLTVAQDIPNFDAWLGSGHADRTAEAFARWDGTVSASCARCHSEGGYRDYLGDDGSAVGTVDADAPAGTVVNCQTCHNPAAVALQSVTFPSGETISGLGSSMRCMVCHQGRASTDDVDDAITTAAVGDDVASSALGFINQHYYAAGATLNAGRVRGGYQYAGELYDVRFRHVESRDVCIECHDQHTLEIRVTACQTCHTAVTDVASLKNIRMMSSKHTDYDGDADLSEGIHGEMVGMREALLERVQAYSVEKNGKGLCRAEAYPYYFIDTNADGSCDDTEAAYANAYDAWTPRLLRAVYNHQVATVDPGAFAHNAKYIIQLLFDSANDINSAMTTPADLTALRRNDPGHFNGAGEPARHWDEDEGVETSCSRCHGGSEGFRFFLEYGVGTEVLETDNGLDCATCHDTFADAALEADRWKTVPVESVTYPSGVEIENPDTVTNLCSTCHQGRASGANVQARIDSGTLKFDNVHYLSAGSTRHGVDVAIGAQVLADDQYSGQFNHPGGNGCAVCHDPVLTEHTFEPNDAITKCQGCHSTILDVAQIKKPARAVIDYDGDLTVENLEDELAGLGDDLLAEMAADGALCYGGGWPYWFVDQGDDSVTGLCDAADNTARESFAGWTPELLRAAFNYQLWHTEPGAWAHNFDYVAQLLIDSIAELGGSGTYVRPTP